MYSAELNRNRIQEPKQNSIMTKIKFFYQLFDSFEITEETLFTGKKGQDHVVCYWGWLLDTLKCLILKRNVT